jgi:hypothetical protein
VLGVRGRAKAEIRDQRAGGRERSTWRRRLVRVRLLGYDDHSAQHSAVSDQREHAGGPWLTADS